MSNSIANARRETVPGSMVFGAIWLLSYFVARFALEANLPEWGRVVVAAIPVIPFSLFLLAFIREIRSADELERRIHLEALAVAFPLAMLLLMILGLLQLAVDLSMDDWSYRHIWPFLTIFYVLGLMIARRRYQ